MRRLIWILATVAACSAEPQERPQTNQGHLHVQVAPERQEVQPETTPMAAAPEPTPAPEPAYSGWAAWCEPLEYDHVCESASDCVEASKGHPAGRALACFPPWWSQDKSLKVCAPGYARGNERKWRHQRLREIVRQAYFDENTHCALDGRPMHKEGWRCQAEIRQAETLTNFLWVPYLRETTARPWKRHRLNPDRKANHQAWVRYGDDYGWEVELECPDPEKKCRRSERVIAGATPIGDDYNQHFGQYERWQYGLGPFGQNAALWTSAWDRMAPPEILCREVEAVESYLRRARQAARKLASGVDCDGDGSREYKPDLTWAIIHRSASSGKICPYKTAKGERRIDLFAARARKAKIDPFQAIPIEALGHPIEKDGQNQRAAEILFLVNEKWGTKP